MKTSMLQSLELEYLALLDDSSKQSNGMSDEFKDRLVKLQNILAFIKKNGFGFFDESDLNLNILTGVNFPLGEKTAVEKNRITMVKEVYNLLATDTKLNELVKLSENRQAELSGQDYLEKVQPRLAELLTDKFSKEFPDLSQHDCIEFLSGHNKNNDFIKKLSVEQKDLAEIVTICKNMLVNILPTTLSKSYNRSYGRSDSSTNPGKIIPYSGVGIPSNTEFCNIYEELAYHFQSACNHNLNETQVKEYALMMAKTAHQEVLVDDNNLEFAETNSAKTFYKLIGVQLVDIISQNIGIANQSLQKATNNINKELHVKLILEENFAERNVSYNREILTSNPITAVELIATGVADSGTIWNAPTYSPKINHEVMPDEGAEGKVLNKLSADFKKGEDSSKILKLTNITIKDTLELAFENHANDFKKIQGIVDIGGIYKKYTNIEIATQIWNVYTDQHQGQIDGVLFYHKNGGSEYFAIWNGEQIQKLENTAKETIKQAGFDPDKLFIYYDELRGTGTDINQRTDAINLLTVEPQTTLIRSLLQGTMRLRKFAEGQTIDIIVPLEEKEETPQLENILQQTVSNQARQKAKQTFQAQKEIIRNMFRNHIALLLQKTDKIEDKIASYTAFKFLFVNSFEDNPLDQYAGSSIEEGPLSALEKYYQSYVDKFTLAIESLKNSGHKSSLEGIQNNIKKQSENIFTELGKNQYLPTKVVSKNSNLGQEQEANQEVAKEVNKEIELDQETEKELDIYNARLANGIEEQPLEIKGNIIQHFKTTAVKNAFSPITEDCKVFIIGSKELLGLDGNGVYKLQNEQNEFYHVYGDTQQKLTVNLNLIEEDIKNKMGVMWGYTHTIIPHNELEQMFTDYDRKHVDKPNTDYGQIFPESFHLSNNYFNIANYYQSPLGKCFQNKVDSYTMVCENKQNGKQEFIIISQSEYVALAEKKDIYTESDNKIIGVYVNDNDLKANLPNSLETVTNLFYLNVFKGNIAALEAMKEDIKKYNLIPKNEEDRQTMLRYLQLKSKYNEQQFNLLKHSSLFVENSILGGKPVKPIKLKL